MAKQSAFGTVPGAAVAYVLPIAKGAQGPEHSRNKIENDARYADGYDREPALGNHRSGADLPLVSNLDIFGYPLYGFCGTLTTTGASAPYTHAGKPGKTVVYYVIEEGVPGTKYYQYVDQVFSELNVEYEQEGLFKPMFKTVGSGLLIPAASSMDTTPTEVAGPPAEMLNWSTLTDGIDEGIVQKLSLNVKREVIEVRAGNGGVCRALIIGNITVTGTVTILFTGDTLYAKARAGTKLALTATITRGTSSFTAKVPEAKLEPKGLKKQSGQAITQEFAFDGIVGTDADSPIKFTLTNGIATHNA
ncbi:MAG TPA: phage tail tube protein [Thermoanaerobaculia bacterium]|nr:phage tail tube protein [Thermoanaerobaculia bacterium]